MAANSLRRAMIAAEFQTVSAADHVSSSAPNPPKSTISTTLTTTLTPSEFHHTITKLAVAQILQSTGFKSCKSSALDALTRVSALFLQSLTTAAASHAAFSCARTQSNVFDAVHAIEQFSLSFGFSGAADINQTLLTSKTLQDIRHFVDAEPPSARRNPRNQRNSDSVVVFSGNIDSLIDNRGPEIPRWLPEFPAIETDDGDARREDGEVLWEKRRLEYRPSMAAKIVKGKKELMLQGRRERVKFRLRGTKKDVEMGGLDDLELRNGVCRGGKRVCLVKRVDNRCRFFEEEEDDDEKSFNIGL
ncbi:hypothetical protein SOVF_064360 [Spinacia oleracea]|uniref:Bromodomain associated domain-containing protein n=1 Tax=Spinacia oleracea TaxID=3562 RepID=A0A9R0J4L6_SPIOL|nr:uncharacterized protein LOC110800295 [Spinacia oleracea]KNA19143.1 hypothetical protein SOVF_064360 [Spinacia oleracea]